MKIKFFLDKIIWSAATNLRKRFKSDHLNVEGLLITNKISVGGVTGAEHGLRRIKK